MMVRPKKKVFWFSSRARVTPRGQNKNDRRADRSSSYRGNQGLSNSGSILCLALLDVEIIELECCILFLSKRGFYTSKSMFCTNSGFYFLWVCSFLEFYIFQQGLARRLHRGLMGCLGFVVGTSRVIFSHISLTHA